jgi:hypothetical protein
MVYMHESNYWVMQLFSKEILSFPTADARDCYIKLNIIAYVNVVTLRYIEYDYLYFHENLKGWFTSKHQSA